MVEFAITGGPNNKFRGDHMKQITRQRFGLCKIFLAISVTIFSTNAPSQAAGRVLDLRPGGSFETMVENLMAGDTLIVHAGTYADSGRISISARGTAAAPIVIRGAMGEARPVITRPITAALQNTINIEGAAYLTIKGLEIVGNGGDGVNLNSFPTFITLEDLRIHDVDVGINFRSSMNNIVARRNEIYRTGARNGTGEGMYVGCNNATCLVSDSLIENNWIHDVLPGTTQGDGIEIKVGSHSNIIRDNVIYNRPYPCIFVYGTLANRANLVEGNMVWNCLEGIYAVSDAIIRNNIILDSTLGLSLYPHAQVPVLKNITAVNNTLYGNRTGVQIRWGGTNMVLANNAIYSPGATAINGGSGISASAIVRNNYIEGTSTAPIDNARFFNGGSSITAFTNAATRNFWPTANSILLGKSDPALAPVIDFNASTRVAPHDVGAYQRNGLASNPGWAITTGFKAPLPPGGGAGEKILDNLGVGASDAMRSFTGQWCLSGSTNKFGANSLYSCGAATDTYRWTPSIATAGFYDVYVWWSTHANRSTSVPISVTHAAGTSVKNYNQRIGGGQWVLHGRYSFPVGTSDYAEVSDSNGQAAADAIKFVRVQ
jgi:Right handed beta helix region